MPYLSMTIAARDANVRKWYQQRENAQMVHSRIQTHSNRFLLCLDIAGGYNTHLHTAILTFSNKQTQMQTTQ